MDTRGSSHHHLTYYNLRRAGFGKLYDGVFPHLIHKNLTKFAEDGVTNRLSDIEGDEEPDVDIKDFVISVSGRGT